MWKLSLLLWKQIAEAHFQIASGDKTLFVSQWKYDTKAEKEPA